MGCCTSQSKQEKITLYDKIEKKLNIFLKSTDSMEFSSKKTEIIKFIYCRLKKNIFDQLTRQIEKVLSILQPQQVEEKIAAAGTSNPYNSKIQKSIEMIRQNYDRMIKELKASDLELRILQSKLFNPVSKMQQSRFNNAAEYHNIQNADAKGHQVIYRKESQGKARSSNTYSSNFTLPPDYQYADNYQMIKRKQEEDERSQAQKEILNPLYQKIMSDTKLINQKDQIITSLNQQMKKKQKEIKQKQEQLTKVKQKMTKISQISTNTEEEDIHLHHNQLKLTFSVIQFNFIPVKKQLIITSKSIHYLFIPLVKQLKIYPNVTKLIIFQTKVEASQNPKLTQSQILIKMMSNSKILPSYHDWQQAVRIRVSLMEMFVPKVKETQLLYVFDHLNILPFGKYIAQKDNFLVIFHLQNDFIIGGFAGSVNQQNQIEDSFLFSLSPQKKTLKLTTAQKIRKINFDSNYLDFGNGQLKIRANSLKLSCNVSGFGSLYYENNYRVPIQRYLGGTQRQMQIKGYEIYRVHFDEDR